MYKSGRPLAVLAVWAQNAAVREYQKDPWMCKTIQLYGLRMFLYYDWPIIMINIRVRVEP